MTIKRYDPEASLGFGECIAYMEEYDDGDYVEYKDYEEVDNLVDELIIERDYWEDKATELANDIALYFGVDFGEHTSHNCPVQNALDYVYGMIREKNND